MKPGMKHTLSRKVAGFLLASATAAAIPASALAGGGLEAVKQYMEENALRMLEESRKMTRAAEEYYKAAEEHQFKYARLWEKYRRQIIGWTEEMKKAWLASSNSYEVMEGIVAGIPSLAKYDLILDAGNPGTEREDVAPFDLRLPDGKVLKRPGNLFHYLLEPALWGTRKEFVAMRADLNGNGKIELGEVLPKADLTYAAARAHTEWTERLLRDIRAWKPNKDDLFTAMVTMVPTVGDYFQEWKESKFITGAIPMFVAQSRLLDVKGIMRSTKVMYFEAASEMVAKVDPTLDKQIRADFLELLEFVDDIYMQEKAGARFKPEQVDALGSEVQDIADRISARLVQAASKLKVRLN